ncbi:MAG TPA: hypothetical protein VIO11_01290 [Candidatus Methanoperedens sp.]
MTFEKLLNIVILSFIVGIIITVCLYLRERFSTNFERIFQESLNQEKLDKKYIIFFSLLIFPATVFILKNLNENIVLYFYFLAGFLILGSVAYILTGRKITILSGLIYPILYFNYWNIYTFNLTSVLLVISLILLMSNMISWKILRLFFILLLSMDIVLVFVTRDMVTFGHKILSLQIPILIHIPFGKGVSMGLGDIFIAGLLCMQFAKEKAYQKNKSLQLIWTNIAFLFIILYIVITYLPEQTYPATIFVGLSFFGAALILNSSFSKLASIKMKK